MVKKPTDLEKTGNSHAVLLYSDLEGEVHIEDFFQYETLWLTQKCMSELFNVDRSVITNHLRKRF
jgi:hypothetical protein